MLVTSPQQQSGLNIVVLDPAHGGTDPGARGTGGMRESEIVLDFASEVRRALEQQGFQVVLTRQANDNPSFDDRSAIANAQRGAVFVTLHISSTGLPGTVRVYVNSDLPQLTDATGMIPWDRAQAPFLGLSRKFGDLVQGFLAQRHVGILLRARDRLGDSGIVGFALALPRSGAYAAGAMVAWYVIGPGSGRPRRQLNRMAGALSRTGLSAAATALVVWALAAAAVIFAASQTPYYWPVLAPHLPALHGWPFVAPGPPGRHGARHGPGGPYLSGLYGLVSSWTNWLFRHV